MQHLEEEMEARLAAVGEERRLAEQQLDQATVTNCRLSADLTELEVSVS